MNRKLSVAAFALGLLVVGWVAQGYLLGAARGPAPGLPRGHGLALVVTLLIATAYTLGALELLRHHRASAALARALAAVPAGLGPLDDWLATLPAALRQPVRQRIEGERAALPGPLMAPVITGLLVLLGMLGTFLGLVVTLDGAVAALHSSTDVAAIRAALSAPVQGLGLAFGTSVAGVAASAMLGLMSALARRERLQVAHDLDAQAAGGLRRFSRAQQRQDALHLAQQQAQLLPLVADRLQALMAHIEQQHHSLAQGLQASQAQWQQHNQDAFAALAESVGQALRTSVADSARLAAEAVQPVARHTLDALAQHSQALHQRLEQRSHALLDGLHQAHHSALQQLGAAQHSHLGDLVAAQQTSLQALASTHQAGLDTLAQRQAEHLQRQAEHLQRQAEQMDTHRAAQLAQHTAALTAHEQQRQAAFSHALAQLAEGLARHWRQAGEQAVARHADISRALEDSAQRLQARVDAQVQGLLASVQPALAAAAEAPQAAAAALLQMQHALAERQAQDQHALTERTRVLHTLDTLLQGLALSAQQQRQALHDLGATAQAQLQHAGQQVGERLQLGTEQLQGVAAQLTRSAVEVASLGDALGDAVQRFDSSSQALLAGLQRIEAALDRSALRNDEQLAWCVAQAREVIDLSLMSQQRILHELQQAALPGQATPASRPPVPPALGASSSATVATEPA